MDIFSFATLLGGLALFLFGMKEMGDGLMLLSGSKLKSMLGRVTSNPVNAVLVGTGITSIIQALLPPACRQAESTLRISRAYGGKGGEVKCSTYCKAY
jgi:hypothetical protein